MEWEARVSVDGKRVPVALGAKLKACLVSPDGPPSKCLCASCARARSVAKLVSDTYRREAMVAAGTPTTVSEWFGEYYKAAARGAVGRKNRGKPQTSVDARISRFDTWIAPMLGTVPMVDVTTADLRRLVQKLDAAVLERATFYASEDSKCSPAAALRSPRRTVRPGKLPAKLHAPCNLERAGRKPGLSAKSAASVWGEITSGFKEAVNSKLDELRVLTVNPALGMLPPTTGENREQAALFPPEILTLLATKTISRTRRRTYFGALYTGMRRSELARITALEVDLERDIITVRGTKTNAAKRQIPIEPALRPLLEVLVRARKAGPLFDVSRGDGKGGTSDLVKKDLARAGIDRPDLLRDDASTMPFTFHGMRHTAVTHWAMAGRPQSWLQLVAGHTDTAMTMRYLDSAAVVRGRFGTPHPALPAELLADLLEDVPDPDGQASKVPAEFRQDSGFLALSAARHKNQKGQIHEGFDPNSHGHLVTPMGIEPMFPT